MDRLETLPSSPSNALVAVFTFQYGQIRNEALPDEA